MTTRCIITYIYIHVVYDDKPICVRGYIYVGYCSAIIYVYIICLCTR